MMPSTTYKVYDLIIPDLVLAQNELQPVLADGVV
jgi:hypothetical protein